MFQVRRKLFLALAATAAFFLVRTASAQSLEAFRTRSQTQLQQKIQATLAKYCAEGCELLSTELEVKQIDAETDELGFESVTRIDTAPQLQISKAHLQIQIDDRIASKEKIRLQKIIENTAQSFVPSVEILWSTIQVPRIGFIDKDEEILKQKVIKQITATVSKVIEEYCPNDCLLNKVSLDGEQVTPDALKDLPTEQIVRDSSLASSLYVKNILVDLTFDTKIKRIEKENIIDLMKAKLSYIEPIEIKTHMLNFPQNSASKNQQDPFGLDRLRETLKIFREMAGTKEIITSTTSKDSKESSAENNLRAKESLVSKESRENSLSETQKDSFEKNTNDKTTALNSDKKMEYYLLGSLLLLIIGALIFSLTKKNRQLQENASARLLQAPEVHQNSQQDSEPGRAYRTQQISAPEQNPQWAPSPPVTYQEIACKRQIEILKDEMGQFFLRQPRISKDVFTRILNEQGLDEAAKYVHVFGTFVLREFMNDSKMRSELLNLSEAYQRSHFDFNDEQTLKILQNLRARVTASEIRMLVQSDPFEFLKAYNSDQIVKLLAGETLLVQGFLLTQLDISIRNKVFASLQNSDRLKIMSELAHVQSIPRDYLESLASALKDKSLKMPDLDSEKINGSDVLYELMQQSNMEEQKNIMQDLKSKNPTLAESLKTRLVSVEIIPYLRDGQVLELVMGMNRQHLMHFLLGTTDLIRDSIINRCPRDLVNTWVEEIQARGLTQVSKIDFEQATASIYERIRYLTQQGGVNLPDINEKIFAPSAISNQSASFQSVPLRKVS